MALGDMCDKYDGGRGRRGRFSLVSSGKEYTLPLEWLQLAPLERTRVTTHSLYLAREFKYFHHKPINQV